MVVKSAKAPSINGVAPKAGYRTITPADAQKMLDKSKRPNRPINSSKLKQYARQMEDGKWNPFNSQAISVDWDGNIVNGHHRLRAAILANVPFETLFVEGVPPDTFATEDMGINRTPAHYLAILGEKNVTALAAGARVLRLWEMGMWRYAMSNVRTILIPNEDIMDEINRRPALRKAAAYINNNQRHLRHMPTGLVGGLWTLTNGHALHEDFWRELIEGIDVGEDSPVRLLRDRLDAAEYGSRQIKKIHLLAITTKAWNAYANGKRVATLAWRKNQNEEFPEPVTKLKPTMLPPEPPESPAEVAAEAAADQKTARRKEIEAKATVLQ